MNQYIAFECRQCGKKKNYNELKEYYLPIFRHGFTDKISCGYTTVHICNDCIKERGKPISVYIGHGEKFDITWVSVNSMINNFNKQMQFREYMNREVSDD